MQSARIALLIMLVLDVSPALAAGQTDAVSIFVNCHTGDYYIAAAPRECHRTLREPNCNRSHEWELNWCKEHAAEAKCPTKIKKVTGIDTRPTTCTYEECRIVCDDLKVLELTALKLRVDALEGAVLKKLDEVENALNEEPAIEPDFQPATAEQPRTEQ